jgi:hypothetical protein
MQPLGFLLLFRHLTMAPESIIKSQAAKKWLQDAITAAEHGE